MQGTSCTRARSPRHRRPTSRSSPTAYSTHCPKAHCSEQPASAASTSTNPNAQHDGGRARVGCRTRRLHSQRSRRQGANHDRTDQRRILDPPSPPTTSARYEPRNSSPSSPTPTGTTCQPTPPAPWPASSSCAIRSSPRSSPAPKPPPGTQASCWTAVDRGYKQVRIDMQKLFDDLAIQRAAA